jgi:hypothetical protein
MFYIADFFCMEGRSLHLDDILFSFLHFFLFATNFVIIVENFSYVDANSYTLLKLKFRILNRSKYEGGTISKLGISFLVHWYK